MGDIPIGDTQGRDVIIVGAIFAAVAIAAFGLRIWAHRIQKMALGWSDYTCGIGLLFALALLGSTVNTVVNGLGVDVTAISQEQLVNFSKATIVGTFTWIVSNTFVRTSILLLYIRIFQIRRFRIVCYATLGTNVVFAISVLLAQLLICRPLSYFWNQSTDGSCGNFRSFYMFIAVFNLITDIIIIVLPLPILWRLQMARSKRLALSGIFGMGIGICVITTFRIIYTATADLKNATKGNATIGLLSLLEPTLGVVNASLPYLKPVADRATKSLMFSKARGNTAQSMVWPSNKAAVAGGHRSDRVKRFQRLDDTGDQELGFSLTSYAVGASRASPSGDIVLDDPMEHMSGRKGRGIVIKRDLEVDDAKPRSSP